MANDKQSVKKSYWVVVADEAQAVFYTRDTRTGPMQRQSVLENPAGRKKPGDLVSDRGGRSFDSVGKGRHSMAKEKSDPKTHAAEMFARQIGDKLSKVVHNGSCRGFALVAAPRFLGMLREVLSKTCKEKLLKTIDKELIGQDPEIVRKMLDSD